MFKWLGSLVDSNEKEIKRLLPSVDKINDLEAEFQPLSDAELSAKTDEFKKRLAEATSEKRQEIAKVQNELAEAQQCSLTEEGFDRKDELSQQCKQLKEKLEELDNDLRKEQNEELEKLLPEAFAAVREAARRTIKQRHYDVQLIGGIVLHQGKIAEMKTGEGKTLVATLPLYLNSLSGQGCHLATVNDYLARRDPYWMGPVYHALGARVASIYPMQTPDDYTPARLYDPSYDSGDASWRHFRPITRREAYEADITYGTSSEFGFDHLRDNMVLDLSQYVQRPLNYAIVDEVDNLLIDEARTPLIISGPAEETGPMYKAVNDVVSRMKGNMLAHEIFAQEEKDAAAKLEEQYDYIAYQKEHYVKETARGQEKLARAFGMRVEDLFGGREEEKPRNLTIEEVRKKNDILSIFRNSMSAHALYKQDKEYVIDKDTDGQPGIVIVDEFTGRMMHGRRYSEGLHQAIEAKEHLKVRRESRTYATITIQNYFRMYKKLGGMTGTAATEAEEFHKIYKLDVVSIPTHKPMIRQDLSDRIYKNEEGKFRAVVAEIDELHKQGRPVLVGTVSIEKSEHLSDMLMRKGITHQVLNAKNHEKEANIIAQAGNPGVVTVATNMAGRGVDIILGGSPDGQSPEEWQANHNKVVEAGGLHVLGTERHEARRIDNQLRGRAGRQGDPGGSRFYVSLEDDIVRRFGGDRIKGFMDKVGMDEDTPIENMLVNKTIENTQVRVEGHHFDMRKHLVEYDDVINKHREVIYSERRKILSGADLKENILSMVRDELAGIVADHTASEANYDTESVLKEASAIIALPPALNAEALSKMKPKEIEEKLAELAEALYEHKEKELGADQMRVLERLVMLRIIDSLWVDHLTEMEHMRQSIGLQAIAQRDPLVAYKRQGQEQFQTLLATIRHDVTHTIFRVTIVKKEEPPKQEQSVMAKVARGSNVQKQPAKAGGQKLGRNDPCPCGSGKKYKKCCGK